MLSAAVSFVAAPPRRAVDAPLAVSRITNNEECVIPVDPALLACIVTEYVGEFDEEGRFVQRTFNSMLFRAVFLGIIWALPLFMYSY